MLSTRAEVKGMHTHTLQALLGRTAAAVLAFTAAASAGTFYVSNAGSDQAGGATPGTAWKTLQHAADVVDPGDTVIVLPGTYTGFNLFTSGTSSAPITFTGNPGVADPNPAVIINGNNAFTNKDRINLEGASWVVIEGFTVLGTANPATSRACIRAVLGDHITVRHNRCDQGGVWGSFTGFVDDLVIEDNEASRSAQQHGVYVSNSGDRPIVRRNRLWGNHSCGLHMNGDESQGGDGVISDALVERNVIYGNGNGNPAFGAPGGSAINCDGVQDSVIRNNLLWDNHKSGIALYRIDGGGGSSGNLVHSNTIHMAGDARWALHISDGSTGNTVRNNILLDDHPTRGAIEIESGCLPGFTSDFNGVKDRFSLDDTWLSLAQWRAATGQDTHSFVGTTALFVNAGAGDYQLVAGSAAIDTGAASLAPAFDLPGKHRPAGAGFDLGAYERGACYGRASSYGAGVAGSGGLVPALGSSGCPDLGAGLTLTLSVAVGGAPGMLLVGVAPAALPKWTGTVLVTRSLLLPFVLGGSPGVAGAGSLSLPTIVPGTAALVGSSAFLQALVTDPGAAAHVSLSPGLELEFGAPEP